MGNNKDSYNGDLDEFVKKLFGSKKNPKVVKEVSSNEPSSNNSQSQPTFNKTKKPMNMKQWVSSAIVLTSNLELLTSNLINIHHPCHAGLDPASHYANP